MPRSTRGVPRNRPRKAAARASRPAFERRRKSAPAPEQADRQEIWRQLFERVPEPTLVSDPDGRLVAANRAALRLLRSRASALEGRPVEALVGERDRPRVRALLSRLQNSRRAALETELDLHREPGSTTSTATTLVGLRGEGGRLRAIGWLLRRVGQPRRLAERLQRTRQEASDLRLALDQAAALLGFDREGRVNEANERCCRVLGRSHHELVGCQVEELKLGPDVAGRLPEIRRTLARGDVWGGELQIVRRDGEARWLHCTVVTLLDEGSRPSQYFAVLQDVTARRVATERLAEQEGLARLGEMAAVVAHEVRNPLAAARGALDVIGPRVPSPGDRRVLAEVSGRLSKLNDLVSDILLYARPPRLTPMETDLVELVAEAARATRVDPLAREVDLSFERPSETLRLRIDAGAIQQAVLNLLRNAVQATGGQGRIVLSVERDGDRCRIRVRDHGPGIPEAYRARIFEPFFTTKHRGSGLGLAIARRTVELHGGQLTLRPAQGGGVEAVIELPVEAGLQPEA